MENNLITAFIALLSEEAKDRNIDFVLKYNTKSIYPKLRFDGCMFEYSAYIDDGEMPSLCVERGGDVIWRNSCHREILSAVDDLIAEVEKIIMASIDICNHEKACNLLKGLYGDKYWESIDFQFDLNKLEYPTDRRGGCGETSALIIQKHPDLAREILREKLNA